ncbi:MAG: malonate--CoA ligase [Pseudomonadota bacterium]|uniref:malonate--CoA ligase n=1 Tax=Fodinicurvata fenggangensis TaxID=1121830 RepID=UPI000478F79D|nr:malonyl-CoA synthase [Fodinicurvata fenggangensis]
MTDETLYNRLFRNVPDADKLFLETAEGRSLTYADVQAGAGRMANALVELGIKPGDRVAVQVEKTPEALLLYLGTIRAGAVYLPLNTGYTLTELAYFLEDAKPTVVVCDPQARTEIASLPEAQSVASVETLDAAGKGSLAERMARQGDAFETVQRAGDDLAAILYTSGTTGRSKGAMLTQENLAFNAGILVDYWRFTADDVLIHALPFFHTHGLFVATNTLLMAGGSVFFLPRFDAETVVRLMPRATALMGVPTFYTRLLAHEAFTKEVAQGMRLFISGSAPLLAETHREFSERTGHAILERYGMTEINMTTSNPYEGERRPGTVGFPLPGTELRVVDLETGTPIATDEVGVIEVRGPHVFKGYWQMPEKTASEFRSDGFFITGDLGKIDTDGYVHIVGRDKDLIISGGFNVYPKEVESEIDALEGVVESAVIGVPHPDFGEGVTAVVVRKAGSNLDEAEVLDALKDRLARYKQPKRAFFVDELPRNTMGKVQKNTLRETYGTLYQPAHSG